MDHSLDNTTGPLEALEYPYQVFLTTLYSLTACFAFVSNLLTIIVLMKGKRCTRDLRKFLINLSVVDLLMAVFTIPFTYTNYMLGRWIFFPIMCPIVNMAQLTTITVSIYTLVAIAIDRYFAIMYPLQRSISWVKQHRTLILILVWTLGTLIGMSQLAVSETSTFVHDHQRYTSCGERWPPESLAGQLYTLFIFVLTFALPMLVLCVVYTTMGCRLLRHKVPGERTQLRVFSSGGTDTGTAANTSFREERRKSSKFQVTLDASTSIGNRLLVESKCTSSNGQPTVSPSDRMLETGLGDFAEIHDETRTQKSASESLRAKETVSRSIQTKTWKVICVRRNKVLKMLITIIGVFTICWLPMQLFTLLIYFKPNFLTVNSNFKYYAFVGSYFFCHWISMAHSFMNPIIYSFMSRNFKDDMRIIFSHFWFVYVRRLDYSKSCSSLTQHYNDQLKLRKQRQCKEKRFQSMTDNVPPLPQTDILDTLDSALHQKPFGSTSGEVENSLTNRPETVVVTTM